MAMNIYQNFQYFILAINLAIITYILYKKCKSKQLECYERKAVLITGCDSGIGNRLAPRLNGMGFKVYATVLNINSIGAQELNTNALFSNKMIVLEMNVTNDSQVMEVYNKVKHDLQTTGYELWSVVNNAGVISAGLLEWGTLDTYRKIFEVNVFGTVRVSRAFLPLIRTSKGRLIFMNSISGHLSLRHMGIYSMTKRSLLAFTDTLRRELTSSNIKVCSIEPGYVTTDLSSNENLVKIMHSVWDQSSPEVKSCYCSPDHEINKLINFKYMEPLSADIDMVVDDIIDSITNTNPKLIYRPMTLSFKILVIILQCLPMHICDKLMQ